MLRFFYNKAFKYTNRTIVDISDESNYRDIDYENIDSTDTINGHIIYELIAGETIPTYIQELETGHRWYVSGITQLRTGKFQISLIRDIISESPELWQNEEAYIEAGTAPSDNFNKYKRWDLPFTNTKTGEERLNINGKSSFFVFYVNQQHINSGTITEDDLELSYTTVPGITNVDLRVNNLNEIPLYSDIKNKTIFTKWENFNTIIAMEDIQGSNDVSGRTEWTLTQNGNLTRSSRTDISSSVLSIRINTKPTDIENNINNTRNDFITAIENYRQDTLKPSLGQIKEINSSQINNLSSWVGRIILDETENKVYRIKLSTGSTTQVSGYKSSSATSTLTSALRNINWVRYNRKTGVSASEFRIWGDRYLTYNANYTTYQYSIEEIGTATGFDFNLIANVRKLPTSNVRCVNIVSDGTISDYDLGQMLMLAQTNPAIGTTSDVNIGRILDIQYLPFSVATTTNENIKINNSSMIAEFLDSENFIYQTDLPNLNNVNKETDTIKIVSPSRASQFLFRPYNNDGNMIFNTKITVKPYTSTIYVRPSTQGLLLTDWDDKDCLIIQEDFSLTTVTSSWTDYVYQNRNYQNAFERNIQGREFERSWERRVEDAQKKSDEWNARNISAQKAQTYTGNLPIISGVAGAIGTAWQDENYMRAAQLDREYNEALYQESINIAREQFSYQLDNIKSQPQIPSKVTTIDCKFLDGIYLEYYSTNETELDAISNYYKYNGNRIDSYGTFAEYYGWFVRGKIIISKNYTQPEIDELNRRLGLGIFTEVEYD